MAAKKNTAVPTAPQRSKKTRQNKNANHDTVPLETPSSIETIAAKDTEVPTPQTLPTATPMPTDDEAAPLPQTQAAPLPTAPTTKASALDAALRVLGESGQAMSCRELIQAMADRGYWSSPKGRTPAGTLYSCFCR